MANTADALSLLDKQLALAHPQDTALLTKFRQEQSAGAGALPVGAAPNTSSVVLGITVDAKPFETTLAAQKDDSLDGLVRHAALLLEADRPAEALGLAQRAFVQTKTPAETTTVSNLLACCFKAQDGTVGRANAWLANQSTAPLAAAPASAARRGNNPAPAPARGTRGNTPAPAPARGTGGATPAPKPPTSGMP
jgi:hypothetical protein